MDNKKRITRSDKKKLRTTTDKKIIFDFESESNFFFLGLVVERGEKKSQTYTKLKTTKNCKNLIDFFGVNMHDVMEANFL